MQKGRSNSEFLKAANPRSVMWLNGHWWAVLWIFSIIWMRADGGNSRKTGRECWRGEKRQD
jgi:hypothetical protein